MSDTVSDTVSDSVSDAGSDAGGAVAVYDQSTPPQTGVPATPATEPALPFHEAVPGAVIGTWTEETDKAYFVDPDKLLPLLTHLRDRERYDFLSSVTCTDYSAYKGKLRAGIAERFDTVYHLYSTSKGGGAICLHVRVPDDTESVPSATSIYPSANLQEREVYDLYGIKFDGHPNLRRILLWEGFHGHPMRKDWKEAYFEEEFKPFKSRHPGGHYIWHEDRLPWKSNSTYPDGWDPESWKEPVTYVPVSQAPETTYGDLDTQSIVVNMGPHHPSTHGVFRMIARLEGETVLALEPEVGYLHRNHEQIGERNTWLMNMPYTDRLDYINSMSNNLGYALAVEKFLDIEIPERAQYIRVIMAELARVVNHFWSIGFILNDLGALQTPALYGVEEREMILDLFEEVSGSRMMCNYMRFGGVWRDLTPGWEERARYLVNERLPGAYDMIDRLLSTNEILLARARGVGYLSGEDLLALGVSGPLIRAAGIPYDIRKAEPYCIYDRFDFDIPTLSESDIYTRYYIRMLEIRESLKILKQALRDIPPGPVLGGKGGYTFRPPEGEVYHRIEAPKGELGWYLVSDNKPNPYRYHVRSPSFINITGLGPMSVGYKVADAVVILGAIDIVLGELDR